MVFIAERVASGDIFNTDDGGDIAGVAGLNVFALVCLNLDQARNAFALVSARVVNRVALTQRAGINSEENQLPDERVAPKFEGQRTKIAVVIRRHFHRPTGIW